MRSPFTGSIDQAGMESVGAMMASRRCSASTRSMPSVRESRRHSARAMLSRCARLQEYLPLTAAAVASILRTTNKNVPAPQHPQNGLLLARRRLSASAGCVGGLRRRAGAGSAAICEVFAAPAPSRSTCFCSIMKCAVPRSFEIQPIQGSESPGKAVSGATFEGCERPGKSGHFAPLVLSGKERPCAAFVRGLQRPCRRLAAGLQAAGSAAFVQGRWEAAPALEEARPDRAQTLDGSKPCQAGRAACSPARSFGLVSRSAGLARAQV